MKSLGILLLLGSMAWGEVPQSQHVWIVTEENHSYEEVIGNSSMPYFNSLAAKYGLATQYYSEQHNSISALMWLVAGQPVTSNNSTTTCYTYDNVVRHLVHQGLSWRSYQEDLPYPGFTGVSNLRYVRRHNPIIDFIDSCASGQITNSVPFSQLATDIAHHTTPNYAYVTPNLLNDAHDGPLSVADYWLSQHIPAILALPEFQPGGDGILFIVWDEAELSSNGVTQDNRCAANIPSGCGGRLATLVIGPQVKANYQSTTRYDHSNLLRTVCDAMGFSLCPGAGAVASPMSDLFNDVQIVTPFANAAVASPVHIQASTANLVPVAEVQVYVDNGLKYQVRGSSVDTHIPLSLGQHYVVVQAWDTAGGIHKRGIYVNVQPEAVVLTTPPPHAVVGSSVAVNATAAGQNAVSKMQLYVDGTSQYQNNGNTLNTSVQLAAGNHTLAVQASDTSGNLTTNKFPVTSVNPSVQILSPTPNSSFYAPMQVSARTLDPTPVVAMQIYIDGTLVYQVSGTGVQAQLPMNTGMHSVVVQARNKSGATYQKKITANVIPVPIAISAPSANSTVTSPVSIAASVLAGSPVQTMQIYVDNLLVYQAPGQSVKTLLPMSSGQHYVVAKGWDGYGNNWFTGEYLNVQ